MTETIIKVRQISKRYRIGMAQKANRSFREALTDGITAPIRNFFKFRNLTSFSGKNETDILWALKDVSFDVKTGEVLGIIGKNGSGKSTLLKILSRITEPSEGSIEVFGRISSLLEVGTGFHPELTGRENIYLNGAILGMKRQEIDRKFDDIVAFSEIGKHIDTPVKRFSSGMYVRLAFAVGAHLEPDILLVDEVLAVGDAEFQKKCMGKMESMADSGRTVIFISHNMAAIKSLCRRTILLNNGRMIDDGPTDEVVARYLNSGVNTAAERKWENLANSPGDETVRLIAIRALNEKGEVSTGFGVQEPFTIEIEFVVLREGSTIDNFITFFNDSGTKLLFTLDNSDIKWHNQKRPKGHYCVVCHIPANLFNEGMIFVDVGIATYPIVTRAVVKQAIVFHIYDPGYGGVRGDFVLKWPEVALRPLLKWNTKEVILDSSRDV